MPEADSLSIKIQAEAENAIKSIDSLINKMGSLKGSLARMQDELSGSSFQREMRAVQSSAKTMADSLVKDWGIVNREGKKQIKNLSLEWAKMQRQAAKGFGIDQGQANKTASGIYRTIKNNAATSIESVEQLISALEDLRSRKIYISDNIVNDLGDNWAGKGKNSSGYKDVLPRNFVRDNSYKGVWQELSDVYPNLFKPDITDVTQQFETIVEVAKQAQEAIAQGWDKAQAQEEASMANIKASMRTAMDEMAAELQNSMSDETVLKNFEGIDLSKMFNTEGLSKSAEDLSLLTDSLSQLSTINFGENGLSSFAVGLKDLNKVNFESIGSGMKTLVDASANSQNLALLANGLQTLAPAIEQMRSIDGRKISQVKHNIEKLSTIDTDGLKSSASAIYKMSNSLRTLSDVPDGATNLGTLASAINKLGYKTTAQAIDNIPRLATSMKGLFVTLSESPQISSNLIQMTEALASLTQNLKGFNTTAPKSTSVFSKLGGGIKTAWSGLKGLASRFHSTSKSSHGLASSIGMLYAKFWMLFRAFGALKKAVDLKSSLVEVQNVVDVTFGNMSGELQKFADSSMKTFGMTELSVKQFASRFQAMGIAMGISNSAVARASKNIGELPETYRQAGKSMADMSINLTALTADMASFYDISQEEVAEDLQSVFTATTKPLRKYGLDLTETNLKQWALKHGIDANIKSMTNAEKTMLRYQYVMVNSKAAMNDYLRTHDTWANRIRYLRQQIQAFGTIIGEVFINAFKPALRALNSFMESVIAVTRKIADALGHIFGWKIEINSGGAVSEDLGDVDEGIGDIGDSADDSADSVKKLKAQLQGFDKLNNLTSNNDSSSGKGSGSGSGSGADVGGDLTSEIKKVDKPLFEYYKSEIDSLQELGKYIGDTIANSLDSIDWDSVYEHARAFGTGLADFLNGLNYSDLFGALGRTVAGGINTVLNTADAFANRFDFTQLGTALSTAVNNTVSGIQWDTALSGAHNWGKGIAETLTSFLKNGGLNSIATGFANAFNVVVEGINSFLTEMDWEETGRSMVEGLGTLIDSVDKEKAVDTWNKIADAIAKFIAGAVKEALKWENIKKFIKGSFEIAGDIDIKTLAVTITAIKLVGFGKAVLGKGGEKALKKVVKGAIKSFVPSSIIDKVKVSKIGSVVLEKGVKKAFREAIAEKLGISGLTIPEVVIAIGKFALQTDPNSVAFALDPIVVDIDEWLGANLPSAVSEGLSTATAALIGGTIGGAVGGPVGAVIGAGIVGGIVNAFTDGHHLTDALKGGVDAVFNFDTTKGLFDSMIESFKSLGDSESIAEAGKHIIEGVLAGMILPFSAITEPIKDFFESIGKAICDVFGIHSPAKEMNPYGGYILEGIIKGFVDGFTSIPDRIKDFFDSFGKAWDEFKSNAGDYAIDLAVKAKDGALDIWDNIKDTSATIVANVKDAPGTLREKVQESWQTIKDKGSSLVANFKEKTAPAIREKLTSAWGKIKEKASTLTANVKEKAGSVRSKVKSAWEKIKTKASTLTANVKEKKGTKRTTVKEAWEKVKDKTSTLTANIKDKTGTKRGSILEAWNKLKSGDISISVVFRDLFSGAIKRAWNGVARGINSAINTINNIPGVNIPKLPLLAKGAVIKPNAPFAAILGDQTSGTNIETPLATMQDAFKSSIREMGGVDTNNATVRAIEQQRQEETALLREQNRLLQAILEKDTGISAREVFNSVRNSAKDYSNRTGRSAFA